MYSRLTCVFVHVKKFVMEKVYVAEISADFQNLFDSQSENVVLNS